MSEFRVKIVGPPLTSAVWLPLLEPEIVNQLPLTLTGSLKVIVISEFLATPVAPLIGVVLVTLGAVSPVMQPEAAFCGSLGVINWKSVALLSVSVPLPLGPPGFLSYPRFEFEVPRFARGVPSLKADPALI